MKVLLISIALLLTQLTGSPAQTKKVLVVMSAANSLPLQSGKTYQTGVFLNEFYLAYKAIQEAGYQLEMATPGGLTATIDPESCNSKYWKDNQVLQKEATAFVSTNPQFKNPLSLEDALRNQADYVGLVIPGGQGLMTDLYYDPKTAQLLKTFAHQGKPVGLICHAPSLLLTMPPSENPFIGYRVNAVSPFEEWYIERFVMKGKPQKRKIGRQLRKMGFIYVNGGPGKSFAVRDRQLITSQNPFSGNAFNQLYLAALAEYSSKISLN